MTARPAEPDEFRERFALVGGGAAEWVTRNLRKFTPLPAGEIEGRQLKRFSELAFVCACLRRPAPPGGSSAAILAEAARWQNFVRDRVEETTYREAVRKTPALAYPLLFPYLQLRAGGYRSSYHDVSLARLMESRHPMMQELLPYRRLERDLVLWNAGLAAEPAWDELYEETILARCRRLSFLDIGDMYSITHTVFYLSDMGRRPLADHGQIGRIASILDNLVIHSWRLGDWDLLCELLLALRLIGRPTALREPWQAAASAFRPEGSLPSGTEQVDAGRRGNEFAHAYHTTLVGVLLADAVLRERDHPLWMPIHR